MTGDSPKVTKVWFKTDSSSSGETKTSVDDSLAPTVAPLTLCRQSLSESDGEDSSGSPPELHGSSPEPLGSSPEPLESSPEPLGSSPELLGSLATRFRHCVHSLFPISKFKSLCACL